MANADVEMMTDAAPGVCEAVATPATTPPPRDNAPSTPPSKGVADVSESSKKTRKKRRKAVTEDEDIAILKAIAEVKPHSAEWGLIRRRWQQVVQRVVAEVGDDEMTAQLAQRRYEILVNRFVVRQELGRLWPPNPQLRELLAEAVEEKKMREKRKKDADADEFVAKKVKTEPSGSGQVAIVERIGDFQDDDEAVRTTKKAVSVEESAVRELKLEVASLAARLVAVEEEKNQRTDALAALMAAQSQCQSEKEVLRKDVLSLQRMLSDAASLAGTLQSLRRRLDTQQAAHEETVHEQNECMQRIIMESDAQQRRISALEDALAREREGSRRS